MNRTDTANQMHAPSATTRAEAAAWLARLHGPKRDRKVEAGLRRWLAASPAHAQAFETAGEAWERAGQLAPRPAAAAHERSAASRVCLRFAYAGVAAVLAALAIFAWQYSASDTTIATRVGEQRTLPLADGSRVHINTATRISVQFDQRERRVRLERGEARFDVAKRPDWPFVVIADGKQVRALGTSFVVRREGKDLSVILVEGKVRVEAPDSKTNMRNIAVLEPGQRLTLTASTTASVDRPQLDKLLAWQRGQVAFDNSSLAAAVDEMNRYNEIKLAIERPQVASLRISGVFKVGDSASFAQAVAKVYQLQIVATPAQIVIAGVPQTDEV